MKSQDMVSAIFHHLRTKENFVPRTTPTIGSFWTVERWTKDHVTVELQDEGSTYAVRTGTLMVFSTYGRDAVFSKGDETMLLDIMKHFNLEVK